MRLTTTISFILFAFSLFAQRSFPVKVNKKWGLMNAEGKLILPADYDGIGEFKRFGYAVMQKKGAVGMIDYLGSEIVSPQYDDIKILDSILIAVMDDMEWMVLNINGEIVLEKGYEKVYVWEGRFLGFMKGKKWGIADITGKKICSPKYDEIKLEKEKYFKTRVKDNFGLISLSGKVILEPLCDDIKIYNDSLFFYRVEKSWGAVDQSGREVIPSNYDDFRKVATNFISLTRNKKKYLYSIPEVAIVTDGEYDDYSSFSNDFALAIKDQKLGLLDLKGNLVLPLLYEEISPFEGNLFRAKKSNLWGIVGFNDENILPFEYQYIAPPKERIIIYKQDGQLGLLDGKLEKAVDPEWDKIEIAEGQAKALKGKEFSIFYFDKEGIIQDENSFEELITIKIGGDNRTARRRWTLTDRINPNILENFEWYYSGRARKFGLRRLDDGSIQIEPSFHNIQVEKELGFTIVGLEKLGYFDYERTSYRFESVHGIVNNEVGLLVTPVNLWDIRLKDFDNGSRVARYLDENGRYGLVSKDPIGVMPEKGYAYIGEFHNGVARMSKRGRISGSTKRKDKDRGLGNLDIALNEMIASNSLLDYTLYDQEFESEAQIICEECTWGYVDTTGAVVVEPQYSFARDFVNEVGIVSLDNKWGLISTKGNSLIPCEYDGLHFMESTNNEILRIYNNNQKFGLIDTLGQVTVNLKYDKIGAFREGRLAVNRNGIWGFVNLDGQEVIPPRFKKVNNFHDGLASVKTSRKWGFIDQNGDTQIDFKFRRLGNFKDGLAWAYTYKGTGYINTSGKMVIPTDFDKAFDFEGDVARVVVNGKYGLINRKGNFVQKPRFTNIDAFNEYEVAIARYGNDRIRYGLVNKSGNLVTKQNFRSIREFKEGLAAVKYRNGYGFINAKGELVIDDTYSKVSDFSNGLAAVQRNGQCGYIDKEGREVVGLEFSKCLDFDEGKAVVYRGYRQGGIIDTLGNFIIEPTLDRILDFSDGRGLVRDKNARFYYITQEADMSDGYYQTAGSFKHGVAVVQSKGRWGVINQKGIEIIPPKYDRIESFEGGYAKVGIKRFNGLTNLKGELIIQPEYEYISYVGEGLFRVEQGDKIGYFNTAGRWVWGLKE